MSDDLNIHDNRIEGDERLYRAFIIHINSRSPGDLPLDREVIKQATSASDEINDIVRELMESSSDAGVNVEMYRPTKYESPIHEALSNQPYLLGIFSVKRNTSAERPREALDEAMDEVTHRWGTLFSVGFSVSLLKYRQDHVLPLIEGLPDLQDGQYGD